MLLDDPELSGVAAVLFDEFHERSLDGDLGLALALDATALREDLRLLVMSATLDGAAVAKLLNNAPIIVSEGRAFPVETRHIDARSELSLEDRMATAIRDCLRSETGSILAFLPGQAEIRRTFERLESRVPPDVDLAPLYGQLSGEEQDRAIAPAPSGRRKVVLATSIAETSLTIDGVRIVVDSGFARVPLFEPSTGLTRLQTVRVSRAAADQRRGRAGRTGPGLCIRLWREEQTASLEPFDKPEMLAADLSSLALGLAAWGISDPKALALLDPPPAPAWNEALALLKGLGALDATGRITEHGQALARLPLPPRLSHMIHEAAAEGAATEAAELAALLSEPGLGGQDTDLAHRLSRFRSERGPRAEAARSLARRWISLVGSSRSQDYGSTPGQHLARAYPDRIAQAAGRPGRFRLVNGRAASLDEPDALAGEPFLVVPDLTGSAASSRIRAAAAISRETIEDLFAHRIEESTELFFDPTARAVRARRTRRLAAVLLAQDAVPVADRTKAAELVAKGIGEHRIALSWSTEQQRLRARSTFLWRTLGPPWPDLSDKALWADPSWLSPFIEGRIAVGEITPNDLAGALDTLLPWSLRTEMEKLLPSHFSAPSGSHLPIDYAAPNGPTLEARVQELFGLTEHPSVAGGTVPLLLVLLSPAHRPIQTTSDLPGFWRGSWKEVAKDLKGRYPRHFWPDDPIAAQATARAKPRGT
jgi:ATP-dependent helicase HrpB